MDGGIPCGVVVVEERDARGSSVRRSRRTGTVAYARAAVAHGRSGGGKAAMLELVGEAGVEEYAFRKGVCKLFRSFEHEGKLTVCTAGMRHQIMISETDPTLLANLCATLLGESTQPSTSRPYPSPRPRATASCLAADAPSKYLSVSSSSLRRISSPSGASGSTVNDGPQARAASVGLAEPLRARSVNFGRAIPSRRSVLTPSSSSSLPASPPQIERTRGEAGGGRVLGVKNAATNAATLPVRERVTNKGRKLGTPTKASVCARLPEQKSTRKTSPRKKYAASAPRELSLSSDQQKVVDFVLSGKSVFFTGCAGTGKSLVLNRVLEKLAEAGTADVFATATTGLAACHLKGTTLQQFAGIGKARGSGPELLKVVKKRPDALRRWKTAQVLIVDEISMLDADTFDALEYVARELRESQASFGGIRLVLSGDFFQLPPVSGRGEPEKSLCFEASSWKACVEEVVQLRLVFRQKDNKFVKVLSRIRWGQCTPEVLQELKSCVGKKLGGDDGIEETQLMTHKADVLRVNDERLAQLKGSEVTSRADDKGNRPDHLRQLEASCSAPSVLRLKLGAQVMLVKNLAAGRGLVNGSRGVVVRFALTGGVRLPVVRFTTGLEEVIRPEVFSLYVGGSIVASRRQLPLALAWALSVHKSQGMSLDRVSVCLSRAFEYGQAYVALSRVRSLEGLSVVGTIDPYKIKAHPKVVKFYRGLSHARSSSGRARV